VLKVLKTTQQDSRRCEIVSFVNNNASDDLDDDQLSLTFDQSPTVCHVDDMCVTFDLTRYYSRRGLLFGGIPLSSGLYVFRTDSRSFALIGVAIASLLIMLVSFWLNAQRRRRRLTRCGIVLTSLMLFAGWLIGKLAYYGWLSFLLPHYKR
jgi:hypothetical protein